MGLVGSLPHVACSHRPILQLLHKRCLQLLQNIVLFIYCNLEIDSHVCGVVASNVFAPNNKCLMPPALVVNHKLQDCKYVGMTMNNVGILTKRSSVTIDVAYVGYVTEQIAIK